MKEIYDYLNSFAPKELVAIYEREYIPFKETGILGGGAIRHIFEMSLKVSDTLGIGFAEKLFIERCAEVFYNQNKL